LAGLIQLFPVISKKLEKELKEAQLKEAHSKKQVL